MSALLTYAHDKNKNLVYIEDAGTVVNVNVSVLIAVLL